MEGFPVPGELIVLVLGIAVVYAWPESDDHVIQIGRLPNGISTPRAPGKTRFANLFSPNKKKI